MTTAVSGSPSVQSSVTIVVRVETKPQDEAWSDIFKRIFAHYAYNDYNRHVYRPEWKRNYFIPIGEFINDLRFLQSRPPLVLCPNSYLYADDAAIRFERYLERWVAKLHASIEETLSSPTYWGGDPIFGARILFFNSPIVEFLPKSKELEDYCNKFCPHEVLESGYYLDYNYRMTRGELIDDLRSLHAKISSFCPEASISRESFEDVLARKVGELYNQVEHRQGYYLSDNLTMLMCSEIFQRIICNDLHWGFYRDSFLLPYLRRSAKKLSIHYEEHLLPEHIIHFTELHSLRLTPKQHIDRMILLRKACVLRNEMPENAVSKAFSTVVGLTQATLQHENCTESEVKLFLDILTSPYIQDIAVRLSKIICQDTKKNIVDYFKTVTLNALVEEMSNTELLTSIFSLFISGRRERFKPCDEVIRGVNELFGDYLTHFSELQDDTTLDMKQFLAKEGGDINYDAFVKLMQEYKPREAVRAFLESKFIVKLSSFRFSKEVNDKDWEENRRWLLGNNEKAWAAAMATIQHEPEKEIIKQKLVIMSALRASLPLTSVVRQANPAALNNETHNLDSKLSASRDTANERFAKIDQHLQNQVSPFKAQAWSNMSAFGRLHRNQKVQDLWATVFAPALQLYGDVYRHRIQIELENFAKTLRKRSDDFARHSQNMMQF